MLGQPPRSGTCRSFRRFGCFRLILGYLCKATIGASLTRSLTPAPSMRMTDGPERILGYRFKNPSLLDEALTHASIAGHRLDSNERMEFLGDAVLGFVVSEHLYRAYPDYLEGELTKVKSAVVSRKVCARVSNQMKLSAMLNLGKGMGVDGNLPRSIAAAVLESVIAAIYMDGGMEPAKDFILRAMGEQIEEAASNTHQQNFKSVLQQYAQKRFAAIPVYVMLDEKGPDHCKAFEVCVSLDGRRFGSAWANSKKEAEQKAALNALFELEITWRDEDGRIHMDEEAVTGKPSANGQSYPRPTDTDAEEIDDAFANADEADEAHIAGPLEEALEDPATQPAGEEVLTKGQD